MWMREVLGCTVTLHRESGHVLLTMGKIYRILCNRTYIHAIHPISLGIQSSLYLVLFQSQTPPESAWANICALPHTLHIHSTESTST